jgi:peroxiredoxin
MALAINEQIVPFSLPAVDGTTVSTDQFPGRPVLGVVFWCNHCPYVKAWEDRLISLQRRYEDRGVRFIMVNSNDPSQYPEDSFATMVERARAKACPFPYLFDETQEVARAYGATRTPEVFLFDSGRVLRYHGAPDDNFEDAGAVRAHYLRDAIEALLDGRDPVTPTTQPRGCTIKWRK